MRYDALLPAGCPRAIEPYSKYWPKPSRVITVLWHILALSQEPGTGTDGFKSVSTLGKLRAAFFNALREERIDDFELIKFKEIHLHAPNSIPTESVGVALFHRGLKVRMGEHTVQAWAMPSSIARAIEADLERIYVRATGIWSRYYAAAARLAHVSMYTCILRGNEPWIQKFQAFVDALFVDGRTCPDCGGEHVGLCFDERTKTTATGRGFDLAMAPTTGAGLRAKEAALLVVELRAQLPTTSPYLYVLKSGKPWTSKDFWKEFAEPALFRLAQEGHGGMAKAQVKSGRWAVQRAMNIRVYRRGGRRFLGKAKVARTLTNLMGRWRMRDSMPGEMEERYYMESQDEPIDCSDLVAITEAKPEKAGRGYAAHWS